MTDVRNIIKTLEEALNQARILRNNALDRNETNWWDAVKDEIKDILEEIKRGELIVGDNRTIKYKYDN